MKSIEGAGTIVNYLSLIFAFRRKSKNKKIKSVADTDMDIEKLTGAYKAAKENFIIDRLTVPEQVSELCKASWAEEQLLGKSVQGRPIYSLDAGQGDKKVLLWTQMHGNEPTATGAVFDLLNFLGNPPESFRDFAGRILNEFHLKIIPMLNPDGAVLYRRTNALDIDLNRDALSLSSPESRILFSVADGFAPHYCFNLHDQRNIYNVSGTGKTATISFLAPAEDVSREVTPRRRQAMAIIHAMDRHVRQIIPGCVGRYSDEFYPTATGDNFQKKGFVTMLIESGTYPGDPERQTARFCNFAGILSALEFLMDAEDPQAGWGDYADIPPNDTKMMDIIVRDVAVSQGGFHTKADIGIMLAEKPSEDRTKMEQHAYIEAIGDLRYYFGIEEVNAGGQYLSGYEARGPQVGDEIRLPVVFEL